CHNHVAQPLNVTDDVVAVTFADRDPEVAVPAGGHIDLVAQRRALSAVQGDRAAHRVLLRRRRADSLTEGATAMRVARVSVAPGANTPGVTGPVVDATRPH